MANPAISTGNFRLATHPSKKPTTAPVLLSTTGELSPTLVTRPTGHMATFFVYLI